MLKLRKKLFVCALALTGITSVTISTMTVPVALASTKTEVISIKEDSSLLNNDNNSLGKVSYDEEKGLICSCGIPFSEHQANEKLRYTQCACGGKIVAISPVYGSWRYSGKSRNCTHKYSNGHDYELVRTYITGSKCSSCSYSSERTGTDSKWECNGF
jgi:hypothetical protein